MAVAHAGSAPKELYGKSITVVWSETVTQRWLDSDRQEHNTGASRTMNIYISTTGRPFVRLMNVGFGFNPNRGSSGWRPSLSESAPGEAVAKDRVDFEGRSIVVYRQFRSGARRIGIDLDDTTCKAAVVNGREGGKNIEWSTGHGRAEVSSVQIGSVSCSIREGNVFGQ